MKNYCTTIYTHTHMKRLYFQSGRKRGERMYYNNFIIFLSFHSENAENAISYLFSSSSVNKPFKRKQINKKMFSLSPQPTHK